jgi:hypothetical protein
MYDDKPLREDEDVILPDVAPRKDLPLDPADAVALERDKYGDDSINPNREDQEDVHRGHPDDIP